MIFEQCGLAKPDVERFGFRHGRHAELAFQDRLAGLVLRQRGGTITQRSVQAHQRAVHFLAQRIIGVQAFGERDGFGQFSAQLVVAQQPLQCAAQQVKELLALQQAPVRVTAFEEFAAIQFDGFFQG